MTSPSSSTREQNSSDPRGHQRQTRVSRIGVTERHNVRRELRGLCSELWCSKTVFREHTVFRSCDDSHRALICSQSIGAACAWLRGVPSEAAFNMQPLHVLVAIRRRLRWALPLSGGPCCKGRKLVLDSYGDRAAACGMSRRLKIRAGQFEKTWARVL